MGHNSKRRSGARLEICMLFRCNGTATFWQIEIFPPQNAAPTVASCKHLSDRFDSHKLCHACGSYKYMCQLTRHVLLTRGDSANKCKHIYSSPEDVDNSVLLNSSTYHRKWAKLSFVATYRRDNMLLLLLLAPKLHDECHRLWIWGIAAYKISKKCKTDRWAKTWWDSHL